MVAMYKGCMLAAKCLSAVSVPDTCWRVVTSSHNHAWTEKLTPSQDFQAVPGNCEWKFNTTTFCYQDHLVDVMELAMSCRVWQGCSWNSKIIMHQIIHHPSSSIHEDHSFSIIIHHNPSHISYIPWKPRLFCPLPTYFFRTTTQNFLGINLMLLPWKRCIYSFQDMVVTDVVFHVFVCCNCI